ncbi:protein Wnt-5 [Toxorhynchites rutilus septentrionalis]|uniref:protein Wnt-5 n=1 Tax=Toxorhynchites rutilus septentrionalis TaxID=329112 RepID=UPI0024791623|nr:protein Wnt-5 [Toxorhynchites rutilus septentrionalis]
MAPQMNLWIILTLFVIISVHYGCGHNYGQGVPTWICLGLKSPFIQFRSEFEVLSNNSISLNLTEIRHKLKSVQNLDHFIRPVDSGQKDDERRPFPKGMGTQSGVVNTFSNNMTITFLTTTPPSFVNHFEITTESSFRGEIEMERKALTEHMISDHNGRKETKYIIPLALKTSSNEKEKTSSIFHGSSTNIDDLKRHILMLQNLTQSDKSFQSKFVVFPSLQKNDTDVVSTESPTTITAATTTFSRTPFHQMPVLQIRDDQSAAKVMPEKFTRLRPTINMPREILPNSQDILSDNKDDMFKMEKITIIPQVFLQNDQTPDSTADEENNNNNYDHNKEKMKDIKGSMGENIKNKKAKPPIYYTREGTEEGRDDKFPPITTMPPARQVGRNGTTTNLSSSSMAQIAVIDGDTKFDVISSRGTTSARGGKKRNRKNQKLAEERINLGSIQVGVANKGPTANKTKTGRKGTKRAQRIQQKTLMLQQQLTPDSSTSASPSVKAVGSTSASFTRRLSRFRRAERLATKTQRSHLENSFIKTSSIVPIDAPLNVSNFTTMNDISNNVNVRNSSIFDNSNNGNHSEKDIINLNPDLCAKVSGLSGGQQKLCTQHTSVMPAISRGARAAIQECKHQFKHRRWNCSTIEDDTVFGPVSNIGSPEMAFVHALSAAAATSFIARACRDGQLASCGCSRSSRPTQLHEDWTWGGCGDDMEFGYKFSQTFIDIKEKEKKRGTRGLVSIPAKYPKIVERLLETLNDTSKNVLNGTDTIFRPEDLQKLQDKIAKEISNSNLDPKEMNELQERINREITNSEVFNLKHFNVYDKLKKMFRKPERTLNGVKFSASAKARALMNLHNNEAGRRAVIKKSRIICKCHGVSGSCSLITCWQQLTSIREIGDFLREKYDESTQVKINKRGRLQVKDPRYKIPTPLDLVYLDESPDWCRNNRQLKWPGTHGRICNKSSSGLDGCAILCCGRGYNTKKIVVKERCNCKFQWCCQVKCDICTKHIEEYTCK